MEKESEKQINIFYKITALWVICEAFAGGILHSVKIPFTGMFISSLSIICIVLIAWYTSATYILKATLLVIIFKFSLSPHTPPTAYLAVSFQGILGYLLFLNKKFFIAAAILLGCLALVESALQRILVLIILYGTDFWKAIDSYIFKLTGAKEVNQISYWIGIVYIIIHFIFGIIVGSFAANLARNSQQWAAENPHLIFDKELELNEDKSPSKKTRKKKYFFYFLFSLLLFFYLQALFYPAESLLPASKVLLILIRSLIILLAWLLIFGPLFKYLLKKYVHKKKQEQKAEFTIIMELIPNLKNIFIQSWRLSGRYSYFKRVSFFFNILILNTLNEKKDDRIM